MIPQLPIRNPFLDENGNLTVPWLRFLESLTRQNVLRTPAPPTAVAGELLLEAPDAYGIETTITPPTPLGDVVLFEVQAQFWDAATGGAAVSEWITLGTVDATSLVLTSGYWPLPAATQYCLLQARSATYQQETSDWVQATTRFAVTAGTPGNVTGIAASYEYADEKTIRVRLTFTAPSPLGVWAGVHVWEEDEDQSASQGAPMDGTTPLNGTRNLGGDWTPADRGTFSESPIVLLLPRPTETVTKRFYLQSRSTTVENPLVRANEVGATPSVTLTVSPGGYQSGEEYARLVTGVGASVEYDDTQVGSPKYSLVFTWTAPTDPPATLQLPFGGVQIVYEYDDGRRANGPALAVNETTARSDWYDLYVGTSAIKCWFVSMDSSEEPRLNTIIANLTPSATATVTWPLVSRPPASKYCDNVTSFTASNARYFINGQGLKQLLIDVTWVKPVGDEAQARWGGVVVWLHTPDGNKYQMGGAETGSQVTIELAVFPSSSESWVFYGVSQDNNANANTDGRSPITGTPTSTLTVGPPSLGAAGSEYTLNVFGASFAASTVSASDGTSQQRITATFSKPLDSTWGGVELRVYDGATLLASTSGTPSPIAVVIPNPAASTTVTAKLVSFDVNGRTNTEVATTPQGNLLIGSAAGTLDLRKFLPASTDNFAINGSLLQIKTGVAMTIDASGNLRVSVSGITESLIASGAVNTAQLANLAINDTKIASDAITTPKIFAGAITTSKIAAAAITANEIAANAIIAGKIAANAISATEIAADAITSSKILAGSVTAGKIATNAISSDKLDATQINVGGGGSKPGKFGVYNASGSQIGFIGVEGSDEGGWFKTLSIGGTSYTTGVIKANSSGQITIDFAAANNANNKILIGQTTYDPAYTTAGIRIHNGTSPATGSDTTWFISRGMVVYGSGNSTGNYYAVTVNRDPYSTGAGEVVVYGSTANSYIRLSGSDGKCRADGGFVVGGNVGVTGSIVPVTGINTNLVTINYKDHSNTNQTASFLAFASTVTTTLTFTGGIRTA